MRGRYPVFAMTTDEELCFARAMEQWSASLKRPDLTEEDRVKGALLAYQRQAFALVLEMDAGAKAAAHPTPGADGCYCAHHPDDPAHGDHCYAPRAVAWLIERKNYEGSSFPHWYAEDATGWHGWIPEAERAKPFATRDAAEAFSAYRLIASDPNIIITEHVFLTKE